MSVNLLVRIIIGLAFFEGVWNYVGLSPFLFRLSLELFILMLFFIYFQFLISRNDKSFKSPGLTWVILFTISLFISTMINDSDLYSSLRIYNRIIFPYLFFIVILNIKLTQQSIEKINRFIMYLVFLQIFAAIYKYIMYGVVEGIIIGTFNNQAGVLSTLFPLLIIGYLIAFYFCYKRNLILLLVIPGFVFFAWGGGKRAFFILLPVLLLIAYIIYNTTIRKNKISFLRMTPTLIFVSILMGVIIYLGGRLNPVFNPEGNTWGSFNFSYMMTQAKNYETNVTQSGATAGRISSFERTFDKIMINGDIPRKLFGDGPGIVGNREEQIRHYGIIYGISGATFFLISSGLIGAISFLLLFISIGFQVYKRLKFLKDPFYIAIAFGTFLAIIIFLFDYFYYSIGFFNGYIPILLFYYILAILLKQVDNQIHTSE